MDRRVILLISVVLAGIALLLWNLKTTDIKSGISSPEKSVQWIRNAGKAAPSAPDAGKVSAKEPVPPMVALVLDDFGYTKKNLESLKGLGIKVTLAVLPNTTYAKSVCEFARKNNMDVLLHLPMEPEGKKDHLEKNTILMDMDTAEVENIISRAFLSVYAAKGISNHMGSKSTANGRIMSIVMMDLKKRDMFFLDSRTTEDSICGEAARDAGVPYLRRDIFIDSDMDRGRIAEQMKKVEKAALAGGVVVAIGHDRTLTVGVMREVVPGMERKGIKFVNISELVNGGK
ncbi:MAG: divergent polysaccharide deacetylase family protein [Candidatus Omnitrophota bacterium]